MKSSKITQALWLIAAAAIVAGDRLVKRYILNNVAVGEKFGEIPGAADFVYVKNTGAAFSIMSGSTVLLGIISALFCVAVVVFWFMRKKRHALFDAALVMIFAGALGNGIDRLAYGFVVDFISVKWFDFPVFNIADMAIVVGAAAAAAYVIFFDKEDDNDGGA